MKKGRTNFSVLKNRLPNLPLVSVVTVTYNAKDVLLTCLKSIEKQHFPNIEYIVIDGGSTDGTLELLVENNDKIDYWISEPDQGIYHAMNKGCKVANGDWILFLGADDSLLDDFSKMCYELKQHDTIYYGTALINGNVVGKEVDAFDLVKYNICHQCIFYTKKVFQKYQYDIKYKIRADHVLNMQCFSDKEFNFKFYKYLITDYNIGGFSSTDDDIEFFKDRPALVLKYFGSWVYILYKIRRFRHWIKGRKC